MVYTDKESVSCRQSGSLLGQLRPGYGFSTTQTVCTKSFHRVISPMPRRSQDMRHIEYRSGILQFPPPSQLPKGGFYTLWLYKKKCGADFVYLQRGSDKTLNRINDALPHTCIDKMPQLRRLPVGWVVSKQENECCSLSRFTLKLSDFFVRTEWKHFLKICPSIYDETKLGNNFQIEQHSYGNFMQISEKTIFSARIKAIDSQFYLYHFGRKMRWMGRFVKFACKR